MPELALECIDKKEGRETMSGTYMLDPWEVAYALPGLNEDQIQLAAAAIIYEDIYHSDHWAPAGTMGLRIDAALRSGRPITPPDLESYEQAVAFWLKSDTQGRLVAAIQEHWPTDIDDLSRLEGPAYETAMVENGRKIDACCAAVRAALNLPAPRRTSPMTDEEAENYLASLPGGNPAP